MKKILLSLALIAALGSASGQSYSRNEIRRYDEREICRDNNGSYHWQVRERRVWVPARRTGGTIFGRIIPAHYEVRADRVKVYHRRDRDNYRRHPHGMPPGQRKKYKRDNHWHHNRSNDRYYGHRN